MGDFFPLTLDLQIKLDVLQKVKKFHLQSEGNPNTANNKILEKRPSLVEIFNIIKRGIIEAKL